MAKKHSEKKLKKCAVSLMYYYARKELWEESFFSPGPFRNFLTTLIESRRSKFFYSDIAERAVDYALKEIFQDTNNNTPEAEAQRLIDLTVEFIDAHAQDCWIFISLENSALTQTIKFESENIVFISGSQDDKQKFIAQIGNIGSKETSDRVKYIAERKAPNFFHSPLLGIKVKHQFDHVREQRADIYSLWALAILHAIYWGFVYPDHPLPIAQKLAGMSGLKKQDRCIVWGDRDYTHAPLNFNTECKLNLDWLQEKKYQEMFSNIFAEIVEKRSSDKLRLRFFKGFRFFIKAIHSERNKDPFDGIELTILYYIVTAEGLLLKAGGEQRSRLKFLLPRLANISLTALSEREEATDKSYVRRCQFVHDGQETYDEWTANLSKGAVYKETELLKRMIAKLLCDSPQHVAAMLEQAEENPRLDLVWFAHLREQYDHASLESEH